MEASQVSEQETKCIELCVDPVFEELIGVSALCP